MRCPVRGLGIEPRVLTLTQLNVWGEAGRFGTIGAVVSFTVKVVAQVLVLFAASPTVIVIVVVPRPTSVPAAGLCVLIREPAAVQLSEAVKLASTSGTIA